MSPVGAKTKIDFDGGGLLKFFTYYRLAAPKSNNVAS